MWLYFWQIGGGGGDLYGLHVLWSFCLVLTESQRSTNGSVHVVLEQTVIQASRELWFVSPLQQTTWPLWLNLYFLDLRVWASRLGGPPTFQETKNVALPDASLHISGLHGQ